MLIHWPARPRGQAADYLAGNRAAEIKRLYGWVISNLTDTVPADAQAFLQWAAE